MDQNLPTFLPSLKKPCTLKSDLSDLEKQKTLQNYSLQKVNVPLLLAT